MAEEEARIQAKLKLTEEANKGIIGSGLEEAPPKNDEIK